MANLDRQSAGLALCAALLLPAGAQAEGVFAQLYAPRPPAGLAFVRLINPSTETLTVQIDKSSRQSIGADNVASTYAIVSGDTPFSVSINGKPAGQWTVLPGSFSTLVAQGERYSLQADLTGSENALKAELRFYNLASDCAKGQLVVADNGPTLFAEVPGQSNVARAINPVRATLSAGCGATLAKAWALPPLKAGDHYSLFLTGSAEQPVLRGELSKTDVYTK
ncbi:cell division protein FtsQ [Pseudomonas sp. MAFF212428]|uniref:Alginate biosynthesis protein AlgF n=1 Tax=Pseudomonas brassicae TaxID=2708063 RepID=A0A6B3NVK5_9PSED|nr:alginate O-acetyltransferase AlgF [Pseudomonas brassicae]NER61116.1 cell division protein FtsQ [Pseudomonas brassicae]NER65996.1 cell division protein FtsQ [Pseudomonas brassicae]